MADTDALGEGGEEDRRASGGVTLLRSLVCKSTREVDLLAVPDGGHV